MSFLADIPEPPRRTDRNGCPSCGTGATTCKGLEWLCGRLCCEGCPGDHDREETADAT